MMCLSHPSLIRGRFVFFVIDNSDFNEDTPDGKSTLQSTATAVVQQQHSGDQPAIDLNLESTLPSAKYLTNPPHYTTQLDPCSIKGNPKPKETPCYTFKALDSTETLSKHQADDVAWLLSRTSCNTYSMLKEARTEAGNSDSVMRKPVQTSSATWSAYNSSCAATVKPLTTVQPLPLYGVPAHEWQTMMKVFKHVQYITSKVMGPGQKTVISLDMALYERAKRLELIHPDYRDKDIFRVGELHTVLCALTKN